MITARGLAQVPELALELVAGARGSDRPIAWAHAIELADPTPYLSGGELVMTTGINIGADAAAQTAYVERLARAGIAALAVDTGTTLQEIPAGVLAAGDAFGLPVLKVPPPTPFIAIAQVVIDAVKAQELRDVARVVDQQQELARATLRGGIPAVVRALADCLAGTVVVTDTEGRLLATAGPDDARLLELLETRLRGGDRRHAGRVVADDGGGFVTVQNLRAGVPVRGRLAVRTERPMSNSERLLVAHAVSLISIDLEKPARVISAEARLRAAVTRDVLDGRGSEDSAVLRYLGFQPGDEVVVVVLTGIGRVLTVQDELIAQLGGVGPYLLAVSAAEAAVVVHTANRRRLQVALERFGRDADLPLSGGISRPVRLADAAVAAQQARIAASSAAPGRICDFAELRIFDALLGGRGPAELRVLTEPLAPLAGEEGLVEALAAYLRNNGQVEAAAAELRVHRHTMRNRLRRIAELLDDDLASADTRAQLWLAIRAWQLLAGS